MNILENVESENLANQENIDDNPDIQEHDLDNPALITSKLNEVRANSQKISDYRRELGVSTDVSSGGHVEKFKKNGASYHCVSYFHRTKVQVDLPVADRESILNCADQFSFLLSKDVSFRACNIIASAEEWEIFSETVKIFGGDCEVGVEYFEDNQKLEISLDFPTRGFIEFARLFDRGNQMIEGLRQSLATYQLEQETALKWYQLVKEISEKIQGEPIRDQLYQLAQAGNRNIEEPFSTLQYDVLQENIKNNHELLTPHILSLLLKILKLSEEVQKITAVIIPGIDEKHFLEELADVQWWNDNIVRLVKGIIESRTLQYINNSEPRSIMNFVEGNEIEDVEEDGGEYRKNKYLGMALQDVVRPYIQHCIDRKVDPSTLFVQLGFPHPFYRSGSHQGYGGAQIRFKTNPFINRTIHFDRDTGSPDSTLAMSDGSQRRRKEVMHYVFAVAELLIRHLHTEINAQLNPDHPIKNFELTSVHQIFEGNIFGKVEVTTENIDQIIFDEERIEGISEQEWEALLRSLNEKKIIDKAVVRLPNGQEELLETWIAKQKMI